MTIGTFLSSGLGIATIALVVVSLIVGMSKSIFAKKEMKNRVLTFLIIGVAVVGVVGVVQTGELFGINITGNGQRLAVVNGDEEAPPLPPSGIVSGACTPELRKLGFTTLNGECTCLGVEDTTINLESQNMFSKGTTVTGNGENRVFVDGSDRKYILDGSSFEASPGQIARVLFHENSTGASTGVYAQEQIVTIPCKGTFDMTGQVCQYDTSPAMTFKNEDGEVMKTDGSTNQTLNADDEITITVKIKASNNQCAGNVNHPSFGNVLCFEFNKTAISSMKIEGVDRANLPQAIDVQSGNSTDCWYVTTESDGSESVYDIVIKTDGINDPTGEYLSYFLVDTALDLDADTLETVLGVEDEDENDLGYTTTAWISSGSTIGFN